MGKLQSEFSKSSNSLMDQTTTAGMIAGKIAATTIPDDFRGNPQEYRRRSDESLRRYLGDEYMLAIQNEKRFDLPHILRGLPATETPGGLNNRAATIENRVITAGEKVDPNRRLRSATIDTQQSFLEQAASTLKDEQLKTGKISPDGSVAELAKASYAKGLTPADVANYALLTEGVVLPQEALNKVCTTEKPTKTPEVINAANAVVPTTSQPALQK